MNTKTLKRKFYSLIPTNKEISIIPQTEMKRNKSLAVVLHTCDKYEFCWEGWYYYFTKFWDFNLECNIYFVNETKPINFKNIIHLPSGKGEWSDRLKKTLLKLRESSVLYLQEDFWSKEQLDIQTYFNCFEHLRMDALRCCRSSHNYWLYKAFIVEKNCYSKFNGKSPYLLNHTASIWRKDFFLSCLDNGETPWENEIKGTKRLHRRKGLKIFHINLDWYAHVCTRGKFNTEGLYLSNIINGKRVIRC